MPSSAPPAEPAFPRALAGLFATTVGVGAALSFGVQPLAARALLPSYGGSSSVWTLCLLFFQAALLLGYGWAHGSLRLLRITRQAPLQIALVAVAAIVAARLPPLLREPSPGALSSSLLIALASGVGLPFVVLATGSPLLSRWYAAAAGHGEASRSVYWLYAASNAGSLGSLLAYPLLIEGRWPLSRQFELFRAGLWLYLALVSVSFVVLLTRAPRAPDRAAETRTTDEPAVEPPPTFRRRLKWMAIAAVPASLLSSVTAHLTTDMASSPLLWVVPLALYLGSFILLYRDHPRVSVEQASRIVPIVALSSLLIYLGRVPGPSAWILVSGLALTFSSALLGHGLLYRERPAAAHLTDFYLCGSIGGALGGAFNALVAPRLFDDLHELLIGILGLVALRSFASPPDLHGPAAAPEPPKSASVRTDGLAVAVVLGVGLGGVGLARALSLPAEVRSQPLVFLALPAVISFAGRRDARRYLCTTLALVLVGLVARSVGTRSLFEARSFYGPLRVETLAARDGRDARVLRHGITLHGIQSNDPSRRASAGAYYHASGPVGDVLRAFHAREERHREGSAELPRIGAVGLGVGTVATYARAQERWVFFELDPLVTQIAETPALFTYLADARDRGAEVRTVDGDARQHLAHEPAGAFSFLILDAFSSDAIPLHLVTREALASYATKIGPRGFMLLHLSNLHLDLPPVVAATAHEIGAELRCRTDVVLSPAEVDAGHWPSIWCVIFPGAAGRSTEEILSLDAQVWTAPKRAPRGWTDERANVLDAVRSPFD